MLMQPEVVLQRVLVTAGEAGFAGAFKYFIRLLHITSLKIEGDILTGAAAALAAALTIPGRSSPSA
ncbi:hypothetical protein D3C85_1848240 [compost metagenome]